MIGLSILGVIGAYLYAVFFIVKRVPLIFKPLVIIAAILLVSVDAIHGRHKLRQMCADNVHIYETVKGVKGIEFENYFYMFFKAEPWLADYGYQYIENESNRLSRLADGSIVLSEDITPQSDYLISYYNNVTRYYNNVLGVKYKEHDIDKDYYVHSYRIIRKSDRKILAEYNTYGYLGGWAERLLSGFNGKPSMARCEERKLSDNKFQKIIIKVLQTKREESK